MPPIIANFLKTHIIQEATRRPTTIQLTAWGRKRTFCCYDLYDDSFIFEEGIWDHLQNKDSIVIIPKTALLDPGTSNRRVIGNILMLSTGNHAITALPLLSGEFWDFPNPSDERRAEVMQHEMVSANYVGDTIEISQRGIPTTSVIEADEWLQGLGCPMNKIVILDRVNETLDHYSRRGQEWRVKPLAWTMEEIENALRGSIARMHSCIRYYHNVKGVHFLTFPDLINWGSKIESDYPEFLQGLTELAATRSDAPQGNLLLKKYHDHHEIEFFGLLPGVALKKIVPLIFDLYRYTAETSCSPRDVQERFNAIALTFHTSLVHPDLGNENTLTFKETLYRNITGEVYQDQHDSMSRSFDDMRKALPGATYTKLLLGKAPIIPRGGMGTSNRQPTQQRTLHEGVDMRTIAILDAVENSISPGDRIEYVNIYEIRSFTSDRVRIGDGKTREIVFKTEWNPLPNRIIEKRLALKSTGYGAYTIARTHAFRALGIAFGLHRMVARNDGSTGDINYFTRQRYPGEPLNALPPSSFYDRDPMTGRYNAERESRDVVRHLAILTGSAAAENLILKKWKDGSIRFGEGKEIVEFGYNIQHARQMPIRGWLCSVRGTMGWPHWEMTDENLENALQFYIPQYARVAANYAHQHPVASSKEIGDAFLEGFQAQTRKICWNYTSSREQFDAYEPKIYKDFHFQEKWRFALWSLERQRDLLAHICDIFWNHYQHLVDEFSQNP